MVRLLFHLAVAVTGLVAGLAGSSPGPVHPRPLIAADSSEGWFRYFRGNWACSGGFSNGRKLDATVSFTPDLGGKWLQYRHADVAPGSWKAGALWGHQARDSGIISVLHDNGSVRVYHSDGWRDGALVFLKDTSVMKIPGGPAGAPTPAPDRFTYRRVSDSTFWFAWELNRGAAWAIGDSLTCRRT